jgi:hypothetical protein
MAMPRTKNGYQETKKKKIPTHHNGKTEKHHWSDLASEPEDLSVGNEDNGQVLEDRVH